MVVRSIPAIFGVALVIIIGLIGIELKSPLTGLNFGILALFLGLESVIDARYEPDYISWLIIFSGISLGFLIADIPKSREQYKLLRSEVASYLTDFVSKIT